MFLFHQIFFSFSFLLLFVIDYHRRRGVAGVGCGGGAVVVETHLLCMRRRWLRLEGRGNRASSEIGPQFHSWEKLRHSSRSTDPSGFSSRSTKLPESSKTTLVLTPSSTAVRVRVRLVTAKIRSPLPSTIFKFPSLARTITPVL
ncbi:unnamed protein product [Linum trigynum]|uniref:Secreted protein n=1 Tax=Linum trigynum TaxID=586398 RepID=A0AAV2CG63_9ROSI